MPNIKSRIPIIVTNLIGAYEKAINESINNLIFFDNVHLDFPIFLASFS